MLLNHTGTTDNNYLYAGEQFDSSLDQYYLRARYYNQGIGRFTQQDTYLGSGYDPVVLHKYLYANADPINYIDPTGQFGLGQLGATISINAVLGAAISGSFTYFSTGNIRDSIESAGIGAITGAFLGGAFHGAKILIASRLTNSSISVLANGVDDAFVHQDKLRYLLLLDAGKANGFKMLGYTLENSGALQKMLLTSRTLITEGAAGNATQHGVKYVVTMKVIGPSGTKGAIEVIWQVDKGSSLYRLITAIPRPFK